MKSLNRWFSPQKKYSHPDETTNEAFVPGREEKTYLKSSLNENRSELEAIFGNTSDFRIEPVLIGKREGFVCYLESMVDHGLIGELIMKPLSTVALQRDNITRITDLDDFRKKIFGGVNYHFTEYTHEMVWYVLSGYAVIFIEDIGEVLAIQVGGLETRSIAEPTTQTIVRGPKDSFIEAIGTNISLIRRRIKNPNLRFESYYIGKDTRTSVTLAFMEGIVNRKILNEIKNRISRIETSAIFDSGNIEEFITDKTWTVFPTIYSTERPDSVASNLIEGKVAIFVDGSPFVLIAPAVFIDFFQVSEDYYHHFFLSSFMRMIRYFAFLISLLLPSLYVAVMTYHHELVPTPLLISLLAQREGVPFPTVVEVLLMEITFEILREAGIRMPRAIGQTVSIVGALVIGEAAVQAGIVSNAMVIVVALTGICNFVSPIYSFAASSRLLRFILIFSATFLGLYGVFLVMVAIVGHLVSLRSFGVPYLASVAPFIVEDQDDVFVRFPIWRDQKRPSYLNTESPIKNGYTEPPSPHSKGGKKS